MEVIIHRVNNIKNLKKLRSDFGAEIDLRANLSFLQMVINLRII